MKKIRKSRKSQGKWILHSRSHGFTLTFPYLPCHTSWNDTGLWMLWARPIGKPMTGASCTDRNKCFTVWPCVFIYTQAHREGEVEAKLPHAPQHFWGSAIAQNLKYTRLHSFKKKNSKMFSPEGPRENVWGRAQECFSGPHCGSRRACLYEQQTSAYNVLVQLNWINIQDKYISNWTA